MQILGHRGARFEAPENTIPGFRYAVELGLKAVEFDIRMSSDGHLVIMHDATVDRTTNGTGEIAALTLAEIQALDARSIFPEWPEPCPVPTFAEVLEAVRSMDILQVEIKGDTHERLDEIVPKTLATITEAGLEAQTTIVSFDVYTLALCQRLAPQIGRGYIGDWNSPEFIRQAQELECTDAGAYNLKADPAIVVQAQALGIRVTGWPTNSDEEFEHALAFNPEIACTDTPTALAQKLAAKASAVS